jgi:hypothetical protein
MIRPTDTVSGRINSVFDRYAEMLKRDTRATLRLFSQKELDAILIACTDWKMIPAAIIPGGISVELDNFEANDLGLTPKEQQELTSTLAGLSTGQHLCLAEWIEGVLQSNCP